jgi:hypothetical protein
MRRDISIRRLEDHESNDDLSKCTPAELIAMVWPLTKSAWAFRNAGIKGEDDVEDVESRLSRHIVRLRKGEG